MVHCPHTHDDFRGAQRISATSRDQPPSSVGRARFPTCPAGPPPRAVPVPVGSQHPPATCNSRSMSCKRDGPITSKWSVPPGMWAIVQRTAQCWRPPSVLPKPSGPGQSRLIEPPSQLWLPWHRARPEGRQQRHAKHRARPRLLGAAAAQPAAPTKTASELSAVSINVNRLRVLAGWLVGRLVV